MQMSSETRPMPDPTPESQSSPSRLCSRCQNPLGPDEMEDICAACLLQVGFESHAGPEFSPHAENSERDSGSADPSKPLEEISLEEVQTLFPDLEILELIGRGGMGIVYKARQKHLSRLVALKILRTKCSHDPSLAERFSREARALARLSHPNIVGVHDFGQAGDRPYLIMEYVDGTHLRQMLEQKTLTPKAALAMVSPICDALQFAHEEGVVHRDIKPENILIDRRGRVRIADFGLARLMSRGKDEWTLTGTRQVMGTPHYMAPEQMERPQEVDHRADIFSLGVVLYEMLTGELPIGRFDLPSQKIDIDVRLDRIVLRTLDKEPARRYQHVSEVQSDVEQLSAVSQQRLPELNFDFTRPQVYIPAYGFLLASLIDAIIGISCMFQSLFGRTSSDAMLLGAAHLLAALPLGIGGWKVITRGSREWMWLVAIFGLLPLHFAAWITIPLSLWTLWVLYQSTETSGYSAQSSSHDMRRTNRSLLVSSECNL
ncbi:MAG: serine/threonine-protein kinase [Pirellulaceae bacterium]